MIVCFPYGRPIYHKFDECFAFLAQQITRPHSNYGVRIHNTVLNAIKINNGIGIGARLFGPNANGYFVRTQL